MVLRQLFQSITGTNSQTAVIRFSRILAHFLSLVPLGWLIFDWLSDNLTADPIQSIMQRTGQAAIILLILSLSCTPLFILFGFRFPIKFKRMLGLYSFSYAAFHFLTFLILDYRLNLAFILADINNKNYIFAGLAALLILTALAITSNNFSKIRLRKSWKYLHRLVYGAGILAAIHYIWAVKADIRQPLIYTAILVILLLVRIPVIKNSLTRFRR